MAKKIFLILSILITLGTAPLLSQDVEWESYGYIKYLFSTAENKLIGNNQLNDHQFHIRLNNHLYFQEYFSAVLEFRLRGFNGSSVKKKILSPRTTITPYPYGDLDVLFWENTSNFGYGQIDRLYLDYSKDDWQVTLGRQRIAWGTSMVWNITDLFNPQSVLDFDYEEKPGSDAIRIQYFTDVVGRIEMVYKPSDEKTEQSMALLFLINQWDYDFYFIAAHHQDKPLFGAAFTGDIEGAGFRGELKATGKPPQPYTNYSDDDAPNISAVLSLDYTFANSLYLHGEALYNSLGKTKNSLFYTYQSLDAGLLSPSQTSLFFETAYELHPLVRGNIFTLINPHENSIIYAPSISWSVITNLDLYLIGLISDGDKNGEFSYLGKAFYLRTKYSF